MPESVQGLRRSGSSPFGTAGEHIGHACAGFGAVGIIEKLDQIFGADPVGDVRKYGGLFRGHCPIAFLFRSMARRTVQLINQKVTPLRVVYVFDVNKFLKGGNNRMVFGILAKNRMKIQNH